MPNDEFNVEIIGGQVLDNRDRIKFSQSLQKSLFVEYAHRVVHVKDEGIFILNGNLCKVHSSTGQRRGGNSKALNLTKLVDPQNGE